MSGFKVSSGQRICHLCRAEMGCLQEWGMFPPGLHESIQLNASPVCGRISQPVDKCALLPIWVNKVHEQQKQ